MDSLPEDLLREIESYLVRPVLVSAVLCPSERYSPVEAPSAVSVISRLLDLTSPAAAPRLRVSRPHSFVKTEDGFGIWSDRRGREICVRNALPGSIFVFDLHHPGSTFVITRLSRPASRCTITVDSELSSEREIYSLSAITVLDQFFSSVDPLDINDTHLLVAAYSSSVTGGCNVVVFPRGAAGGVPGFNLTRRIHDALGNPQETLVRVKAKWLGTGGNGSGSGLWRLFLLFDPGVIAKHIVVRVLDFSIQSVETSSVVVKFLAMHRTVIPYARETNCILVGKRHDIFFDTHPKSSTSKILVYFTTVTIDPVSGYPTRECEDEVSVLTLGSSSGGSSSSQHPTRTKNPSLRSSGTWQLDSIIGCTYHSAASRATFKIVDNHTSIFIGHCGGALRLDSSQKELQCVELDQHSFPFYISTSTSIAPLHYITRIQDPNFAVVKYGIVTRGLETRSRRRHRRHRHRPQAAQTTSASAAVPSPQPEPAPPA